MNSDGSNNQSLKYQRFTPSGFRDIGIRKLGFVAKTQFLSGKIEMLQSRTVRRMDSRKVRMLKSRTVCGMDSRNVRMLQSRTICGMDSRKV